MIFVCGLCSTFNSAQVCVYLVFTAGNAQCHLCVLFNTFNNV